MNWKLTCQFIALTFFVLSLFITIFWDINGRKALEPKGFSGVACTLILFSLYTWMYHTAGLFSLIFP